MMQRPQGRPRQQNKRIRSDRFIRFQGNRIMMELSIGRTLTKEEAIVLYNNSSIKTEVSLWGYKSRLKLIDLNIKAFNGGTRG